MMKDAYSQRGIQMGDNASVFILGSFVVSCSAKVPRLPRPGESLRAEAFTAEPGGKGFNLALGARRLGATVDGLLAVGNDFFSQLALPALTRAGLPPAMVCRYEGTTGSGIGFTDADGENCLAVFPGANRLLTGHDVRQASYALSRASLVLAQFEIDDEPILEAFTFARENSVPTLLNPSPYRPIDPRILERTSILVVNQVEASQIQENYGVGLTRPSDDNVAFSGHANFLLEHGPDTVITTLGKDGAYACQHNMEGLHQPAFPVRVIDTLGAGDAFTAGLAASLLEGRSLSDAMRRAAACGAIATQKLGVFEALPTRADLEGFLSAWA